MAGILYLVPTPIGNLGDLSERIIETLREADFIAAEDTRVSLKILNHLGIKKPMVSYYRHTTESSGPQILSRILAGENCALVTDAGTPQSVLTLDEAIQKLEEKFDSMIVEGEWRVDEIEMAYIAVPIEGTNDARLLPVWRFQTEHTMEYAGKDDPSQTTTLTDRGDILFNALDGTELLKNNGSI